MADRNARDVLGVRQGASWTEIRFAYHALARRYHADGTNPDRDRMVEINAAYARLEREHTSTLNRRAEPAPAIATGPGLPGRPSPAAGSLLDRVMAAHRLDTPVVDFGQYAGWRVADIAECDPRYLRWLSRHSSGHRYRAAIERVLGSDPQLGRRAALVG